MGAQVLERMEAGARSCERPARHHRTRPPPCAAQVAGRPGVRAREVAGEEPVGRPLAEAAQRDEPRLHLVVGQRGEPCRSRSLRARPSTYSALRREKPTRERSSSLDARDAFARRGRRNASARLAVALDEAAADRERGVERDLLRRDRGDERLERIGRERRTEAREQQHEPREHVVARRPAREGVEIERRAEQRQHLALDRRRRAARRRRRRAPPRSAPRARRSPGGGRPRARGSRGRGRRRGSARSRAAKSYGSGRRTSIARKHAFRSAPGALPIEAACAASPRIVLLCLAMLGFVRAALPRRRRRSSWAQPQIKAVVAAGLFAETVPLFEPQQPLTQSALGARARELACGADEHYRYSGRRPGPAGDDSRSSTQRSSASSASATPPARVTAALRRGGLTPKAGDGTETVARLLGLRFNHPAAERHARARPERAGDARRGRVLARPCARARRAGSRTRSGRRARNFVLPELTGSQRDVLRRAVSFVGYPYVWGGTSELPQQPLRQAGAGRLRLLRLHLARLQARAVRRRLRARHRPPRPYDVRAGG